MNTNIKLIILLFLSISLFFLIKNDIKENFNENTPIKGLQLGFKNDRKEAPVINYNKKFDELRKNKPLNHIFDDKLYTDVIQYENDLDGRNGLDKCIESCNGLCVEYGQTGIAQCYPNDEHNVIKSSFYETLRDKTYKTENTDEKPQKLIYANLR